MEVYKIRGEMQKGRSIFDLPLRVAFYARVSTEKFEQLSSLDNQIEYYSEFIKNNKNWTFIDGYIDEGISGTSTKKRDSFNRMVEDAKAGRFDLLITKEISRFSRSTLDSILYTQELLKNNVGVFFQNDNINTLDPDSEFRLVVMAGVAQDEVRKLSERLKFGFRQSIRNARVLGNDSLWGYDKKSCRLTVNEDESGIIKLIFDLYVNEQIGMRRISQMLLSKGIKSRKGNAFNTVTIRHILSNPKYKGWYCGNKTKSIDYRQKKSVELDKSEWVCHPDPSIPAIIPENEWDKAQEILKNRRESVRKSGVKYGSRYPYSGKIICGEHNLSFHRQKAGEREVWQCRIYRTYGRKGCAMPALYTSEINEIMACIFMKCFKNHNEVIESIITLIKMSADKKDYGRQTEKLRKEASNIMAKKNKLLDLSVEGAIGNKEFREKNEEYNNKLNRCQEKMSELLAEEKDLSCSENSEKIKEALKMELSFKEYISAELVAAILNIIIVRKTEGNDQISLEIFLKSGEKFSAYYKRERYGKISFCIMNS